VGGVVALLILVVLLVVAITLLRRLVNIAISCKHTLCMYNGCIPAMNGFGLLTQASALLSLVTLSQSTGTCTTNKSADTVNMLKMAQLIIPAHSVALHLECCGKCDLTIMTRSS